MSFYPVKSKKLIIKKRHFHYFVFDDGQHLYIKKRIDKDIWQDLHEFALQESDNEMMMNEDFNIETSPIIATQQLTHQKIFGYFYLILMQPTDATIKKYSLQKVNYQHIKNFAWPKLIVDFLSKQGYI
jgi:A/G-specific adenine glycosylase